MAFQCVAYTLLGVWRGFFHGTIVNTEEMSMGLFSRALGNLFNERGPQDRDDTPDLDAAIEGLAAWTTGKRMADAGEKYSAMINTLPPGTATSMRLSDTVGTLVIDGEQQPVLFGYPGKIELNMPALTELAGTARILLDLGYEGIEHEKKGILRDLTAGTYRLRVSCISSSLYPLVRLQIGFFSDLQEPLHLEVLSDMLDCNVQDFYLSLCDSGCYELSLHVMREHIGSVFATLDPSECRTISRDLAVAAADLASIPSSARSLERAIRECERRHPLGEGMRR